MYKAFLMCGSRTVVLFTKRKKKYPKLRTFSEILKSCREYCNSSTIGGLNYIGGSKKKVSLRHRAYFTIWFTVCLACTVYHCCSSIQDYLKYDLKTTIQYNTVQKLDFPAITLCNANRARKSIVGQDDFILASVALLFSWRNDTTTIPTSRRTCNITGRKDGGQTLLQFAQLGKHISITDLNRFIGFDSNISVLKCWWNNMEMNCNKVFVNHYFEEFFCFTFNQDPTYVNMGGEKTYYGMEEGSNENRTTINPSRSGFQVLLNTRQDEYCLTTPDRNGAGFFVLIHDAKALSSFRTQPSFDISPGFEHSISFTPILFDLRGFSESRGRCSAHFQNILKQRDVDYTQESCLAECLLEIIWNRCRCIFSALDSPVYSQLTADYFHITMKTLLNSSCMLNNFVCMKDVIHDIITNGEFYCPQCKRSCLETKYEFQITSKRLSRTTLKLISNSTAYNESYIQKNFVLAKFYFKSMDMITVHELQLVSPLDLFMTIANIVILFLGMSMVSHYELVHLLLMICHNAIVQWIKNTKKKGRRKTVFIRRPTRVHSIFSSVRIQQCNSVVQNWNQRSTIVQNCNQRDRVVQNCNQREDVVQYYSQRKSVVQHCVRCQHCNRIHSA